MAEAPGGPERAAFARSLSALKERGSSILVVGTAERDGHSAVCDRLLGDSDEPRRRLLVRTDGACGAEPASTAGAVVVEQWAPMEGGGALDGEPDLRRRTVEVGDVEGLESAVVQELAAMTEEEAARPGEVRLCVDSLRPLLVDHGERAVRQFVEHVGDRVTGADGMAHFHLPSNRGDRFVSTLSRPVDAVVEVRVGTPGPEHRWHVFDGAVDSGWLPL